MKPTRNIVFDSYAILAYAQDDRGADKVERYLAGAEEHKCKAFINRINLGEVYYIMIRNLGLDAAKNYLDSFSLLPAHIVEPSPLIIISAAEIKANHAISYADCFVAATAFDYKASIITGDPEFKKIEHLIEIDWI
jgi:ribonuclease VapC